jgi:hypothetical protein
MKKALILFLLLSPAVSQARELKPEWKKYAWEENRSPFTLSAEEKNKPAIIMLDKRMVEIFFDTDGKKQEVNTYVTKHVIVRVNSDNAIEEYNKVYIPMYGVTEVMDLEARFISKEGKIITFDSKNVKDVENYNNYGPYKIFALEGVEIGGEVEYIYTVKRPLRTFGTESYRSSYDYREITLDIIAPSHLKYDAKGYNGLTSPVENEDYSSKNVITLHINDIKGFEDEMYSADNASYPRVEYKLAYNIGASKKKRLNTWNDAADIYMKLICDATSSEKSLCKSLYAKIGVKENESTEEKIRKIESYVKTNFTVRDDASGDLYDRISGIVKVKLASEFGIMRLYQALFEIAGISNEIVITSDRFEKQFDGEFDSWTYLQHFLLYFPSTKKYIAPTSQFARYGFVTPGWAAQDGLFIRTVILGGETSALGTIKPIESTTWKDSQSGLYASLKFDLENRMAFVHTKHTYTGYAASFIQPYYNYLSVEDRRESMNELLKSGAGDAKPKNLFVRGYNSDDTLYYQPFSVEGDFSTNTFIEYACGKYIFKVGEVIGSQVEMYQEHERRTDMVLAYPHGFHREIRFEIPEGFRASNLEALRMDVFHEVDNERTMEFTSNYVLEGRTVIVTVEESYRQTFYPKEVYTDFRNVINASADFNKVVVYFETIAG